MALKRPTDVEISTPMRSLLDKWRTQLATAEVKVSQAEWDRAHAKLAQDLLGVQWQEDAGMPIQVTFRYDNVNDNATR